MANTYLSKTQSGAATLATKYTISCWIKRSKITDRQQFIRSVAADYFYFEFQADDRLHCYDIGTGGDLVTNRVFRDTSSWYHIVLAVDTTLGTADDRVKLYVNGVQETSFAGRTNATLNSSGYAFNSSTFYIGSNEGSNLFFNGSMSHLHGIDGTAYDASAFGSTDATTGEWEAKTSPSVTYGNNGFFILKDGNGITDQSGEGNNFTLSGGTLTDLKDNPDNVFAVLNTLCKGSGITLSNGNCSFLTTGTWESAPSTLAVSSGKYYTEFKWSPSNTGAQYMMVGVAQPSTTSSWITNYPGSTSSGYAYGWDGAKRNSGSQSAYGSGWSVGNVIGIALDMDNKKLYFHKDGVWQNSGVPTSGATGTGALSLTGDEYYFVASGYTNTESATINANFGNGYFGTTAITTNSGNGYAGAEGSSKFNYTVPAGYSALSTKGLNE